MQEYGHWHREQKLQNYRSIDAAPFSIVALHNTFLDQIRRSFVAGAYFPALVGACALGERVLNQLVIELRDEYSDHQATTPKLHENGIMKNRALTNWKDCRSALVNWGVISDIVSQEFAELFQLRSRAIHYNRNLDGSDARELALAAVLHIQKVIESQFAPLGGPPRFIEGISGNSFLSTEAEQQPFIRRFFLPSCVLVSPRFEMRHTTDDEGSSWFEVYDDESYQDEYPTLTDEEFASHRSDPARYLPPIQP
ncbi:hypothetical protein [Gordonia insulae]|uniref:hypothetical protein n=1 Tax=Gordonia insulae TaxID=2420509 RepID=UPI000F5BD298|nr:hypothetical protein [Gordonia insulae]